MADEKKFPIERFSEIEAAPGKFRLLERIPLTDPDTRYPVTLAPAVGDEIELVIVDLETTGLDPETDHIIEVGLAKVRVSPSVNRVTEIVDILSQYEDPGRPIPDLITKITGITDDMVAGHRIDDSLLADWVPDNVVLIAHNASFDRRFFDRRFPGLAGRRWACSSKGIDWQALGFESRKLEYLVLRHGFFYTGHRAAIDCLAVAWLLFQCPDALGQLRESESRLEYAIRAVGAPFEVKDRLKERGYQWKPELYGKAWRTVIQDADLSEEKAFLAQLYPNGDEHADIQAISSRTRFL